MIAILIISFFIFLVLGMPIAFVMGSSASLAFLVEGISPIVLAQRTFTSTNSFALLAIPLFMLAGNLMERTEITKDLVNFCDKLVGHIRGGLAHTTCLTGMVFAAMCGSNNASAAAIGSMMIPALRDDGYDTPFAVSLVAAAGNLGPIIPPSIIMIIYASATNLPIKDMFMAGVVPGILMGIGFMAYSYLYARKLGMKHKNRARPGEIWVAFKKAFFALLTPIIILSGIATGIFTATESGAVAVLYCIIYGFIRRKIVLRDVLDSLYQAAISTLGPNIWESNHFFQTGFPAFNFNFWNSLSDEDKQMFTDTCFEIAKEQRANVEELDKQYKQSILDDGGHILERNDFTDIDEVIDRYQNGLWKTMVEEADAQELYEIMCEDTGKNP